MWQCHYCRSPLSLDTQKKHRLCPTCGSDLHSCKNCIHYNEALSSKCREPNSPWVADRTTHNGCEFFEMGTAAQKPPSESAESLSEAERAKEAFKALFRTP